jgi:hypothetical protein
MGPLEVTQGLEAMELLWKTVKQDLPNNTLKDLK